MAATNLHKKILMTFIHAFAVLIGFAVTAHSEDYARVQGYVHSFNNSVSVYTGVFALNKDLTLDTSAYFKYNIDLINPGWGGDGGGGGEKDSLTGSKAVAAVSGASSAVTSGGSSSKDTRHEVNAGVAHNFNNLAVAELYYDFSREKDYTSHTPTVSVRKDLFEKNTTLTFGYSRNIDSVSGQFAGSAKGRDTGNFFFGVTQVLSPFTVAQAGYSRSDSSGFESEGIRLVPLNNVSPGTCTAKSAACVDEAFPDSRERNAYLAGVSHYFLNGFSPVFKRSSIKVNFRYYDDSWDIKSYAVDTEYYKYLADEVILRLNYRYYDQTKAFFVKDVYTGSEEFKSASPQLLQFNSNLVGVKVVYNFSDIQKDSGLQAGSAEAKYEYYTESIGVNAHIVMVGLKAVF